MSIDKAFPEKPPALAEGSGHCDNCSQRSYCTYSRATPKRRGRPKKSIDPPTLAQYVDGRYRRKRKRSLLVPVELDVPQEFSGSYRNWVRKVLTEK